MRPPSRSVGLLILVAAAAAAGSLAYALSNARKGYAPRQPIQFRHSRMAGPAVWQVNAKGERVNVGGYDVPCLYCHTMPYKGRHSTVPSTAVCMNCHGTVGLNREWVLRMKEHWERGEPISWVKVHDLPDFVYYDHSAHLNAKDEHGKAKLACKDCHGEVEKTDIVRVQTAFNMGWCVECHRKPEMAASTDCIVCHR